MPAKNIYNNSALLCLAVQDFPAPNFEKIKIFVTNPKGVFSVIDSVLV